MVLDLDKLLAQFDRIEAGLRDNARRLELIEKRQSDSDSSAQPRPAIFTKDEFGKQFRLSRSTVDRALSHGMVRVIRFGDRPYIPAEECDRIGREGLASIPRGYKRAAATPKGRGRPRRPNGRA